MDILLRQGGDGSGVDSDSPSSIPVPILIVLIIIVLLVIVVFTFILIRLFLNRRTGYPALPPTPHYFPTSPPALVRRQRLAANPGLTMDELTPAAPLQPFVRQSHEEDVCPVCLEDMTADTKARRLPCGHAFDALCIEEWAAKANRCPVCNAHIVDENDLRAARLAVIHGNDPDPHPAPTRTRRRRHRAENGVFELRNPADPPLSSPDLSPPDSPPHSLSPAPEPPTA